MTPSLGLENRSAQIADKSARTILGSGIYAKLRQPTRSAKTRILSNPLSGQQFQFARSKIQPHLGAPVSIEVLDQPLEERSQLARDRYNAWFSQIDSETLTKAKKEVLRARGLRPRLE